jgi:PAS domain S-box-containing protein
MDEQQSVADAASAQARHERILFRGNPLPLWIYDLQTLRFLDVNDVACSKYGYTREEFLARSILDIRPADDIARVEESVRTTPPEVFNSGLWRHRLRDGTLIDVEITSHEMIYEGRRARFVCPIDVTERLRAERALRESERRFRQLAEHIREVFFLIDRDATEVLYVSPGYETVWGRSCESLYADPRSWMEAVHPDDLETVRRGEQQRRLTGRIDYEYRILRPDGTQRWIGVRGFPIRNEAGEIYRTAGLAEDITERKATEQTHARLAAIVECSSDAIVGTTLDGMVTSWNGGAERLFGFDAAEMLGRSVAAIIPAERRAEDATNAERLRRGERVPEFQTVRRRKDGRLLDVSLALSPLADASGRVTGVARIARDITERVLLEDVLREREAGLRRAQAMAGLAHVVTRPDGSFESWSESLPALIGIAPERMPRSTREWLSLLHPDDRPIFRARAIEAGISGRRTEVEYRVRRPDGSWMHMQQAIEPIEGSADARGRMRWFSTQLDVTEQKQVAARLQMKLARLQLLHRITRAIGSHLDLGSLFGVVASSIDEQMPVAFCFVSTLDAATREIEVRSVGARSRRLAQATGFDEGARLAVDRNGLARCVRGELVYEPDIAAAPFELTRRLARGGLRSVVLAPLQVESEVFGVIVAAREEAGGFSSGECEFLRQLSEHVALAADQARMHGALQSAYDELRRTQQAVLQQERLRALGEMASGIAHDINNALSPVALYTESLLDKEEDLSERAREQLRTIQRSIDDVAETVARMREFYRPRDAQVPRTPVALNTLIRQVVELTRARWRDMAQQAGIAIEVRTELQDALPPVLGVEGEIREALTNLVFNAVDALPAGGSIVLRSRRIVEAGAPARVEIEVSDSGVGMDEETRRRCMEPFFTTKGERGTGLGLAMVYGTAQRLGATLEIDSAPGAGTTVRLAWQRSAGEAPTPSELDALRPLGPVRGLRLLLIDDDPLLLRSLCDILECDGHVVSVADGGQRGIELCSTALAEARPFDVVITDLGMPKVDGRQVARAVKAATPQATVVMLTGWGRRMNEDGEHPPHVDHLLSKPPRAAELRAVLARCGTAAA